MSQLGEYFKRVMEFPGVVRRPEQAKLDALAEAGATVLSETESDFQRVLFLETPKRETMLLLDGELQFYSGDEHRYHECLTIIPFLFKATPVRSVGVMGGGDGLVARELLRHFGDEVESVHVVDIDPAVTELARSHPRLVELNAGSLLDERVTVLSEDASRYRSERPHDLIICDLPDPTTSVLGKLYTREYYEHLRSQLAPGGLLALQIVYFQPLFDGILKTLRGVFPNVKEYSVGMYSFCRCGFAVCAEVGLERSRELPSGTRYLTDKVVDWLFYFPPDEPRLDIEEVSTDQNLLVLEWYEAYLRDQFEERILYY